MQQKRRGRLRAQQGFRYTGGDRSRTPVKSLAPAQTPVKYIGIFGPGASVDWGKRRPHPTSFHQTGLAFKTLYFILTK